MADDKNKRTIYQNLNSVLNLDGFADKNSQVVQSEPKKIIIRGDSPEDIQKKSLEIQQRDSLWKKFFKATDHGFQKAMQYEANRLPAYHDYEGMEYYPLIASALDLFMEEATIVGNSGKMLNIYSNKPRIKEELEDLFYNKLSININLPFWTRNMPVKWDSIIPLLDGTEITIKDLSDQIKSNPDKEFWTYSVQDGTNSIVAGKIVWCDLTRKDETIYKVHLDDNSYIETSGDHEYIMRNGSKKPASELKAGDSLMPFYTKKSNKKQDNIDGYEKIFNPSTGKYKFTHKIVAHDCIRNLEYEKSINEQFDTHHVDFNKLNNHPNNLVRLTHSEHFKLHIDHYKKILGSEEVKKKRLEGIDRYLRSDARRKKLSQEMFGIYPEYFKEYNNSELHKKHNDIRKDVMLNHWADSDYKKSTSKLMQINMSDNGFNILKNEITSLQNFISKNQFCESLKNNQDFINDLILSNSHTKRDVKKSINTTTLEKLIQRMSGLNYLSLIQTLNPKIAEENKYITALNISQSKTKKVVNHKVVSIEILSDKHDVYCMEVVGKNGEHDRHNFPICSKNIDGTYTRNGVFLSNCKYGDNFVYLLAEKDTGIISAKQLVNYEMERIEKIENGKLVVKFKQRETSSEFNLLEIIHFRMLGDDKFMPYGSSILNKIRRVFRQLVMAEDAMLTYRIIRAGEKRVFKIDVGNIDDDDIEAYMYKVATKFKKTTQVQGDSGNIDYRFNILGNDEDFFLPIRNGNVQTGIDTLPGAQNLDQIADIEYLRDNLFTGLGVPRPFLGYQASAGEGKNMAQADVRFAKKINRIQQALVQELNKMAVIHLYLKGYKKEDCNDFVLRLSNPSTQQDLLKTDLWTQKANLYNLLTTSPEGGIAPMSHTNAKQFVFEWSEAEIAEDLKKQRMERVVGQELVDSAVVIKQSGLFTDLDQKFGSGDVPQEGSATGTTQQMADGLTGLGGEELPPLGAGNELPPVDGLPMKGTVGGAGAPTPTAGGGMPTESRRTNKPLLNEMIGKSHFKRTGMPILDEDQFNRFIDIKFNSKFKESLDDIEKDIISEDISLKSSELRNNAFKMISEIDLLMEKANGINSENSPKIPSYIDVKSDRVITLNESDIKDFDLDDIGLNYDINQKEKEE